MKEGGLRENESTVSDSDKSSNDGDETDTGKDVSYNGI